MVSTGISQREHERLIVEAHLIENVQFVYELALAQLELESFGVKFTVRNGLREFLLEGFDNLD